MSGATVTEPPRPRPLSGGLWTLFSWLRREEHSSSESLSSAGSDRTAASFAFLTPAHYGGAAPAPRPPPPPPTDSYRKRVRDRNLRRHHDRDITLHRKYGLYGFGYDALSLPSGQRAAGDGSERDRRAASESPRAHVPGKRRAPPPPATASLTRHRARKRPAPLPPLDLNKNVAPIATKNAETEPMNRQPLCEERRHQNHDNAMGCKPEKYSKKDAQTKETKDIKIRHEKSFLKQIFENKKRNSAVETSSIKLLPNISELDKQAAEMIEKYRLKELTQGDASDRNLENNDPGSSKQQIEAWICTRCLRKYNSSVITCNYCLPLNKTNDSYKSTKVSNNYTQTKGDLNSIVLGSSSRKNEDKEKLKEMLKEMKDSLPKKLKNDLIPATKPQKNCAMETRENYTNVVEAPTLRIGSSISMEKNPDAQTSSTRIDPEASTSQLGSQDKNISDNALTTIDSVVITQPVVLVHTKESNIFVNDNNSNRKDLDRLDKLLLPIRDKAAKSVSENRNINMTQKEKTIPTNDPKHLNIISKTNDINTPLKISSLLNPIYVPKSTSTNTQTKLVITELKDTQTPKVNTIPEPSKNDVQIVGNLQVPSILHAKSTTINPLPKQDKQTSELNKIMENKETASCDKIAQAKAGDKNIETIAIKTDTNLVNAPQLRLSEPSTSKEGRVDQHARRRNLINQLERSIAKGDERAAAEAAVKLAQLRLSCSVLSFSSHIVAEATASPLTTPQQISVKKSDYEGKNKQIEEVIQKCSQTKIEPANVAPTVTLPLKQHAEKIPPENIVNQNNKEKLVLAPKVNVSLNTTAKDNLGLPRLESGNDTKLNSGNKDAKSQNLGAPEASTSKGVQSKSENDNDIPILIWVEDKEATRGPVQLHVRRDAVLGDLSRQAEQSLGLAERMQRWIVGRNLCSDNNMPLVTLAGPDLSAPFYLCLVESDTKNISKLQVELKAKEDSGNVYNELVQLEKQALVSNGEIFECGVCLEECPTGGGIILRECVHSFCKECLSDAVRHSQEPVVSCPATGCRGFLQEREIRALVSPDDYDKWLARGLAAAESGTRNAFHCRTRDCSGWAMCDPGVRRFPCPVCKRTNCVPCQAIHEGDTCEEHRRKLQEADGCQNASQTDEGTQTLLNTLISKGEALQCPECSAIITKKWGCDWVKCSACKTEICWVTKGRRWGPAGRGDTTGGCRCGVDGKRCHPTCGYCH